MKPKKYPKDCMFCTLEELFVDPERARKDYSGLPALVESITENGLLNCITVSNTGAPEGFKYNLVAGQTRYMAMCAMGVTEFPVALFEDLTSLEQKQFELVENLTRKDLHWSEKAELLRQIHELKQEEHGYAEKHVKGWGYKDTAALLNSSEGTVTRMVNDAKKLKERPELAEEFKHLPQNVAMKKIKQEEQQEKLIRLSKSGDLTFDSSLKQGSCLDLIKGIPDSSVDLILTDPPFGVSDGIEDQRESDRDGHQSYKQVLTDTDNLTPEAAKQLIQNLMPELHRVLKPGGHIYVFFAFELYPTLKESMSEFFDTQWAPIIWNKLQTMSVNTGYNYATCYEPILFGWKTPRTRRLKNNDRAILECKPTSRNGKIHPFEKPQDLLKRLIDTSTSIGDTVLDPFAGSGSTLLAAKTLRRSGIGFEFDEGNFLRAQNRLMEGTDNEAK